MRDDNPIIDIGVNLTNKSLMQNLEPVLQRANNAGVNKICLLYTSDAADE